MRITRRADRRKLISIYEGDVIGKGQICQTAVDFFESEQQAIDPMKVLAQNSPFDFRDPF